MRRRHSQELDASVDTVWGHFMDLRRVGCCFPGAEVTHVDGDDFIGHIRARLGPFTLTFDGEGTMTRHNRGEAVAALSADGQERHGFGRATIEVSLSLVGLTDDRTRADLATDLVFHGAPMDFGRGLVQRASDPLVGRFLTCMSRTGDAHGHAHGDEDALDLVRSTGELLGSFRRGRGGRRAGA